MKGGVGTICQTLSDAGRQQTRRGSGHTQALGCASTELKSKFYSFAMIGGGK